MSITFTQTDTTATFSISTRCQTYTAPKVGGGYKDATDGGTAGTTEISTTITKTATETALEFITGPIDANSWGGSTGNEITFNLDVTSLNANVDCTSIYACRLNSGGTSQATYGTWTGTRTLSTNQTESFTLTTTAQATVGTTDRILFMVNLAATSAHSDESIGITPSQDIVVAGITPNNPIDVTGTLGAVSVTGLTSTLNVGADLTGTLGAVTATGLSGIVEAGAEVSGTLGTVSVTGLSGIVEVGTEVSGTTGAVTATGLTGTIELGLNGLQGTTGAVTATGLTGTLNIGTDLTGTLGTINITGLSGIVEVGAEVSGSTGAINITGLSGSVNIGKSVTGTTGVVSVIGYAGEVFTAYPILARINSTLDFQLKGELTENAAGSAEIYDENGNLEVTELIETGSTMNVDENLKFTVPTFEEGVDIT